MNKMCQVGLDMKINYLLTEAEVITLKTERSRLISSLLYGIFYYENQYNRN